MKTSVLINEASIVAPVRKHFTLEREQLPATVWQKGLGVGESIAIQFLAADVDPDSAADTDWVTAREDVVDKVLDANNNIRAITTAGVYAFYCTAADGAVKAGIY